VRKGLLEVGVRSVLFSLGHLQDLLLEGVLVVAGGKDFLVLQGQVAGARRGSVLHGLIGLLLDHDDLHGHVIVVIFVIEGKS
jgi:hypothetical protein